MIVPIRLFARARDLAGRELVTVELADGATVADLRIELGRECPALMSFLPCCAVAVGEEFADDSVVIGTESTVAIIPPVSGGALT